MYRSPICIIPLLLAVSACTNTSPDVNPPSDSDDMRVSFGTYVERNGYSQTRATDATANGIANNISTAERLQQVGFGVFAYYTDNQAYDDVKATAKPNFFWNQQVTYDATNGWTYSPEKYWPNEHGSQAISTDKDLISFFAYAPFVKAAGSTADGATTTGASTAITAFSANSVTGDPYVNYKVSDDATQSQDLLWGVASSESKYLDANGDWVKPTEGLPNLNFSKQRTTDKVRFRFKHALYRLGLTVKTTIGNSSANAIINPQNGTIVLIKEVKLKGAFPREARLNLYNTEANTPNWQGRSYDDTDASTIDITTALMNSEIADLDYATSGQGDAWTAKCAGGGVNSQGKQLLPSVAVEDGKSETAYITMIPCTDASAVTVELTYTLQTIDPSLVLTGGYARQEHTLTQTIDFSGYEAGKTYVLNLVFNLQEMSFTVDTEEWKEPIFFDPEAHDWVKDDDLNLDF